MSKKYEHVRFGGCRSPLMISIFIIVFVVVFAGIGIYNSTINEPDADLVNFANLIGQEYNEDLLIQNAIGENDYQTLYTKINNSATNSEGSLFDTNTDLRISRFGSNTTSINSQLTFSGQDISCLLNLALGIEENNSVVLNSVIQILSCSLNTDENITNLKIIAKINFSGLVEAFTLLNFATSFQGLNLPDYIYLTLNSEIDNSTANNYLVSSTLTVNNLGNADNISVLNYFVQLLTDENAVSATELQEWPTVTLVTLLKNTLQNWGTESGAINVLFTGNELIIG